MGETLIGQMRETGIGTPFVVLAEEETERVRQALGCSDGTVCLCKDADPDHLKATLAELIDPGH